MTPLTILSGLSHWCSCSVLCRFSGPHSDPPLVVVQTLSFFLNSVLFNICATVVENSSYHGPAFLYCINTVILICFSAAEVALSSVTLASRTATTLSVTWSAGYPKCYSFTVSHSTQDGSTNVTQPGGRVDGQRAKVVGNFTTEEGEE